MPLSGLVGTPLTLTMDDLKKLQSTELVSPPGWASDSRVKWLTNITVLDTEFDGFWMKFSYRKPDHPR
jgi:DMSO/TMAO reductase YedYZ molybdopterin-dependent catalytic subunit